MEKRLIDYKGKRFKISPYKRLAGICVVSVIDTLDANKNTCEVQFLCDESISQDNLEHIMDSMLDRMYRLATHHNSGVMYLARPEHSPVHSYIN